jgi:hypothetical protein
MFASRTQIPLVPATAPAKRLQVLDNDDRVVIAAVHDLLRRQN